MTVIPEGYAQCSLNFTGENVPQGAAIVIGVSNPLERTAIQLGQQVYEQFDTTVPSMCTVDVTLVSCDVKLGPNDTGAIATYTGTPTVGASGSTSLSPGTAVLAEKVTALGGRRNRGRMYWPGVYDGWVNDNGTFGSGVLAQINGFLSGLLTALVLVEAPMHILHSPSYTWELVNGQPRRIYGSTVGLPEPTIVSALNADPVIATQRRRLR